MKPSHQLYKYSLEERMVEPFRSIRWLSVSRARFLSTLFLFLSILYTWFVQKSFIFDFWKNCLLYLSHLSGMDWGVAAGPGGEPKLEAWITAPNLRTLELTSIALCVGWILSARLSEKFVPLKACLRFFFVLIGIGTLCFAFFPGQFRHSVEEWSKTYFTVCYGMLPISSFIWMVGIGWFPIPWRPKLGITCLLIAYELIGTPLLIFTLVLALKSLSLLFLPVCALALVPLLRLGWFVGFYSYALSFGELAE